MPALRAEGVDANVAAGCLSLVGALGIVSKISSGIIAHKIGAKRTMQLSLAIQEISVILLVVHGMLPASQRPQLLAWAAAGVYGLGFGAVGAMIPLVVLEEYGVKVLGKALGIVGFGFMASGMIAPAVAGAFFDSTGQYTGSFIIAGGVFLVAIVILEVLCLTAPAVGELTSSPPTGSERKQDTMDTPEATINPNTSNSGAMVVADTSCVLTKTCEDPEDTVDGISIEI